MERDILTDRAILYSLNLTNVGDSKLKTSNGGAAVCRKCPDWDEKIKQCKACAPGHYVDINVKFFLKDFK